MRGSVRSAFIRSPGDIRDGWLAALFLAVLLALLAPLLIWSQAAGHSISVAEQAVLILLVTWMCQRLRGKPLSEAVGRFDVPAITQFAAGAAIGAILMILPAMLLFAVGAVAWAPTGIAPSVVLTAIVAAFTVAIAEELLFRGFLFQRLIGSLGLWAAQIAMSGLFLLTHLGNPGMEGATKLIASINIFAASLLFGLAYARTRGLAMPIGIHFAANTVQGAFLGLGVSGNSSAGVLKPSFASGNEWLTGGSFGLEASLPGTICVLVALLWLARSRRWKIASAE